MMILRSHLTLALAVGLMASGMGTGVAMAHEGHEHAADRDHDAEKLEERVSQSLASLAPRDRQQAEAQRFCPMMTHSRLGAMGTPIKVLVEGEPVFVCCKGCVEDAVAGGRQTLETAQKLTKASATLAKLTAKDRAAIEAQKYCAVANKSLLGSMGVPLVMKIDGKPVYLCCKGCVGKARANPAATLARAEQLKQGSTKKGHDHHDHQHGDGHSGHRH